MTISEQNLKPLAPEQVEFVSRYKGTTVPVELLDEIRNLKVSTHELEDLLAIRRMTAGKQHLVTTIESLQDADLRGKTAYVYFRNWEDSEWLHLTDVVTVLHDGGSDYRFKFSEEMEACWNDTCEHAGSDEEWDEDEDDDEAEDLCFEVPGAARTSFFALDQVIVVW